MEGFLVEFLLVGLGASDVGTTGPEGLIGGISLEQLSWNARLDRRQQITGRLVCRSSVVSSSSTM